MENTTIKNKDRKSWKGIAALFFSVLFWYCLLTKPVVHRNHYVGLEEDVIITFLLSFGIAFGVSEIRDPGRGLNKFFSVIALLFLLPFFIWFVISGAPEAFMFWKHVLFN